MSVDSLHYKTLGYLFLGVLCSMITFIVFQGSESFRTSSVGVHSELLLAAKHQTHLTPGCCDGDTCDVTSSDLLWLLRLSLKSQNC